MSDQIPNTFPRLTPVDSSNLLGAGYDRPSRTLFVAFKGGALYAYRDVPRSVFEGLLAAESKGQYFHRIVKGAYEFVKLDVTVEPTEEAA